MPSKLLILGGGYIGLEFAQAMRRLGAAVTVIDRNKRLLKNEDEDIANMLVEVLQNEGVMVSTSTMITEVSGKSGSSVTLKGTMSGEPVELTGSHMLCATARLPNTQNIGLENVGVKVTDKGFVKTDENLHTSSEGIFAVGDCAGSPYFTHVAFDDFRIVRDSLLGKPKPTNRASGRQAPFTLCTPPELAYVGLREHEAISHVSSSEQRSYQWPGSLKHERWGEITRFAKTLIEEDETIFGFTALEIGAGELLPVVQLAMKRSLPHIDIAELVITHPTLNEGLVYLFSTEPARG